ncbi:transmembrane protein 223 [Caerostris extrusa]|uniref:Transmembrane protein 223 n=1 Tax=Caerostris extrusa TaxID=172846 RepID=A0AAV4SA34_CAEEX|nr:transmembrane protein 223 [Caerostris extrusa]
METVPVAEWLLDIKVLNTLTSANVKISTQTVLTSDSKQVTLRDTESLQRNRNMTSQSEEKSWRDLNLGAAKHRLISAVSCFSIGFLTAFICYKLPSRMIKLITLSKGGRTASFVTYGSFGKTEEFKVPLQQLTCVVTRDQATSYIPIKIKNRWFYYLIDCRGQFHQPALFLM